MGERWWKFKLPFFRMSACAHGTKPFDILTRDQCIDAERQLIAITKRYISYGIAITVVPRVYEAVMPVDREITGSPYSFCAHACLTAVKAWVAESKFGGEIGYFFESGHRSQSEADAIMKRLFQQPQLRASHRYAFHAFADKKSVRPLQAADLIAWQWHTDQKRRMAGGALWGPVNSKDLPCSKATGISWLLSASSSFSHSGRILVQKIGKIAQLIHHTFWPSTL